MNGRPSPASTRTVPGTPSVHGACSEARRVLPRAAAPRSLTEARPAPPAGRWARHRVWVGCRGGIDVPEQAGVAADGDRPHRTPGSAEKPAVCGGHGKV